MPLQAVLHGVEGFGGTLHLARPAQGQGITLQVIAEILGGSGQFLQRRAGHARDDVRQHRNRQHQQGQEPWVHGKDAVVRHGR